MTAEPTSPLRRLLDQYRGAAQTQREAGTYFEELTLRYLRHEPAFAGLYVRVEPYATWAGRQGLDRRDAGIDLVAETAAGEVHAVQCKLYPADHTLQKADIDSFFTASGKRPFTHRLIISTTDKWSAHAEDALRDQQVPVQRIDLAHLEASVIDWSAYRPTDAAPAMREKKALRPHQRTAIDAVLHRLPPGGRGQLIMACGTGKTFTSLKLAEEMLAERVAAGGGRVLFLVPSLALLSQSLTEWTQESALPLRSFAVCSDSEVGKKRRKDDDEVQTLVHELAYPATTAADRLAAAAGSASPGRLTVVFATYHSLAVVAEAQAQHGLPEFDLILCDEAHRTTGARLADEDESAFIRVHDAAYVRGDRRLYMTATPRVWGDAAKANAEQESVTLCSMDDEEMYGKRLYVLSFSEAVKRGLLVDYKVLVLAVEEAHVSRRLQELLKDADNDLRVDDAARIVGCWKALAKQGVSEDLPEDTDPMRRAVAFCQVISQAPRATKHKVASTSIAAMFQSVVEAYQATAGAAEGASTLRCEAEHVDGGMNASQKEAKLTWLKAEAGPNTCRILSNVRCLSEGVDVPALDAVLFLTPRNSQVDVVQSVGRVMRKAPGKVRGYVVLPVVIPAGIEPHEALNDNKTYKVVWQVLQALRSHDDRFDAMVNKLDLTGGDPSKMEVIAVSDRLPVRRAKQSSDEEKKRTAARAARGGRSIGRAAPPAGVQTALEFEVGELERAIFAKVVQKVGNRHHWEDWARDIADIARRHIDRITGVLDDPRNTREREAFDHFAHELRDDLNDSISRDDIIEMLAQHLVTRPVFEALFAGHSFVSENSMSKAMQGVLDVLDEHHLEKEASTLQAFYDSVKLRAEGIESAAGKQKIVVELYDKFFRNAFPKMAERLGIVYTPVELVDFVLHSVDHLLRQEFGQTIGSEGVHVLDPFTGTGTFITRLLQSGLIPKEDLPRKYAHELHANELVLLAYYIAAINIEANYHEQVGGEYTPFPGICLTDTFQLYEKEDLLDRMLVDNSARRVRQKQLDIRVIVGNPPYSVGQKSANDNNQNVEYPKLDQRIAETYAARSEATNKNALYDSYIRAIRWASDRVGAAGIIGFVTNAGFVDANTATGLRRCLAEEFSDLYIFHLRGNQRTAGELSRREGGKVFGGGSRAPVAISLLVKNSAAAERGRIHFRDVGDYLSREDKLRAVEEFGSVGGISEAKGWTRIEPDAHGDWLKQRDDGFAMHLVMGDKRARLAALFDSYSPGVQTNRDAWVYGPSRETVAANVKRMVDRYNSELDRWNRAGRPSDVDTFVVSDTSAIKWTSGLKARLSASADLRFDPSTLRTSLYRPFSIEWLYSAPELIHRPGKTTRYLPGAELQNVVIGLPNPSQRAQFSVLMTDHVPCLEAVSVAGGSQYFPLYVYDTADAGADEPEAEAEEAAPAPPPPTTPAVQRSLFGDQVGREGLFVNERPPAAYVSSRPAAAPTDRVRRDGITDAGLAHFQIAYPETAITKEDLFYYVYGILHSPDYRERYADNLGKELPRIPRVKAAADFWAFVKAGRRLGELHVGYERVPEHPARVEGPDRPTAAQLRVEKMKFGKGKDKSVIHYNAFFTVRDIPLEAYDYVVNGKPAIEWVMERQAVTTDKDSGIVKDANAWATETVGDPRYPLSLLLRVITVSLETMKVVRGLPKLVLEGE
jgi:predicted helicase